MSPEVQIHIYDYDDILPHLYNNRYRLHRAEEKSKKVTLFCRGCHE